ncbi:D-alanine--D-alanine ligase [Alginatibacterium sediminis]|uniref:D-alanine--D-alanine ligase n=2 Tax=Alginatibacterium sediminis TaxID=2164068 RepID=A0A420E7J7_9ALTE|nr:D-alanine--D-alanine ligase [Alginatibacterium sediminis]
MPELKDSTKKLSFYEFWPTWLVYIPVAIQWLLLSVRYRSLTLPLIANPRLPLSGMVGVGKSELFEQAQAKCAQQILTWFTHTRDSRDLNQQVLEIESQMHERQLTYPIVAKPDIGCRGIGVKLVHNRDQLAQCLICYPNHSKLLLQRLSSFQAEAGVFFVRDPRQQQGRIISMALKYTPFVVGDGISSLAQLVAQDARASQLTHLYQQRHAANWNSIIAKDEPYRLVFSASHSKGAIFTDAKDLVTEQLNQALNEIMQGLPEFHYGRLDIKFKNIDALKRGEQLEIVEINSASSESLHIWDSSTPFKEAMRALLYQYRLLFKFGDYQRQQGHKPPGLSKLLQHWRKERELSRHYPLTD